MDTIKYDNNSFRRQATTAIDQAIAETSKQASPATIVSPDVSPDVGAYLLLKGAIVSPIEAPGEKSLYQLVQFAASIYAWILPVTDIHISEVLPYSLPR